MMKKAPCYEGQPAGKLPPPQVLLLILLLWLPAGAGAQAALGAADMDLLLGTEAVDFAAAALWVQSAAGLDSGVPLSVEGGKPIRLDEFAFMLVRAFGFKGGLMYTLFPGPRYAYRELIYRGVLEGRLDPAQTVSGERLLYVLGRALEWRDNR